MNIENHFNSAEAYLEMANEKVERQDYTGARASLAQAYSHTRELLDLVQKLIVLKANVELSTGESPMLSFTDHMKRIINLSEQVLVHVQAEKYEPAAHDLVNISVSTNEAIRLLDEFSALKHQGGNVSAGP